MHHSAVVTCDASQCSSYMWCITVRSGQAAYQYNTQVHVRQRKYCTMQMLWADFPTPPATTADDWLRGELVYLIHQLEPTTLSDGNIRDWIAKHTIALTSENIHIYILTGWPNLTLEPEFKPFDSRRREFSVLNGCILWGSHFPQDNKLALQKLHETDTRSNMMKCLAFGGSRWKQPLKMWWRNVKPVRNLDPPHPDPPLAMEMVIITMVSYPFWLRWSVLLLMPIWNGWTSNAISISSSEKKHGINFWKSLPPRKVAIDDGPSFISAEFQNFTSKNGIIHIKSVHWQVGSSNTLDHWR